MPDSAYQNDHLDCETVKIIQTEGAWERMKLLYGKDEGGKQYPEAAVVSTIGLLTAVTTGMISFGIGGSRAYENFLDNNHAAVYKTRYLAQRHAMDAYAYGGLKSALKYGFLSWAAITSFAYLSLSLELYRNKTSSANYALSGALLGGVSRFSLGPRGMAAGAFLGGYAGLISGFLVTTFLKRQGLSFEDRHFRNMKAALEESRRLHQYDLPVLNPDKSAAD